jgi:PPM family protein phosphatase
MLRVAEHYAATDTGRQRRANEDALLARSPLFVVADGMGGAQAGEVASRLAVEAFQQGLDDASEPQAAMAALAHAANSRIYKRSHSNAEQAGMGTTLTAIYVGEHEVSIAHVGDSRAYCMREGRLLRLTDDHSLVDELLRQGRLTPEEAVEHPQRSVITRALGPELAVDVDTRSFSALPGDVYLICSDGLTTMVSEDQLAAVLLAHPDLHDAGEALIAAANEAGGRDNITVVLLRVEEVLLGAPPPQRKRDIPAPGGDPSQGAAQVSLEAPVVARLAPRRARDPSVNGASAHRRRARIRRAVVLAVLLATLGVLGSAAYLALQSVYFIGTNDRGLVTVYRGVPYRLPAGLALYSGYYVSGVDASTLSPERRRALLDHSLRSEGDAAALIRSLELGQLE